MVVRTPFMRNALKISKNSVSVKVLGKPMLPLISELVPCDLIPLPF